MHGIEKDLGRPVYGLAENLFRTMPVVGTLWARSGGVAAHPDNAYRLLHDEQQLVLVFPEGTKGTGKLYSERYQLRRFGRGGFVEIAMRAGVPVDPDRGDGRRRGDADPVQEQPLAKLMNIPYFPVTANMLMFGPAGLGDLPAGEVPDPRAAARALRRAAEPGALLAQPRDGGVGTHPPDGAGRALRHAAHPPQRLVRVARVRVLVTGLSTYWGGRVAQALERRPDVEVVVGLDTRDPRVPLERTEFVRADSTHSILARIVRADAGRHDRAHAPHRRLDRASAVARCTRST